MVTGQVAVAVRGLLRSEALSSRRERPVQGKLASMSHLLYAEAQDLRYYSACKWTPQLRQFALHTDTHSHVDLSRVLYRCIRAIGGGWMERLHSDSVLASMAADWAAEFHLPSSRVCPLCSSGTGTPRHVIMCCPELQPCRDAVCDAVERELISQATAANLTRAADSWWLDMEDRHGFQRPVAPPRASRHRWPVLSAWRWLVPILIVEEQLDASVYSSVRGVRLEGPADLAYRCLLPKALGRALICHGREVPDTPRENAESQPREEVSRESAQRLRAATLLAGPIRVTTMLLVGIRKMRAELSVRMSAWRELRTLEIQPPAVPVSNSVHLPVAGSASTVIASWASSLVGSASILHMRARLLPLSAVLARTRIECRIPAGSSDRAVVSILGPMYIPYRQGESVGWGDGRRSWDVVRSFLQRPCQCSTSSTQAVGMWICPVSRLSKIPGTCAVPVAHHGVCDSCSRPAQDRCPGCLRGVHFGTACGQWMHGVDVRYGPGPSDQRWLCPLCLASLVREVCDGHVRPRLDYPCRGASQHMAALSLQCLPGAGVNTAHFPLRARALRAFVLSLLTRSRWTPLCSVRRRAREWHRLRSPAQSCSFSLHILSPAISQAVRSLVAERKVWTAANGSAICLRDEASAPLPPPVASRLLVVRRRGANLRWQGNERVQRRRLNSPD
jgi:hypothetical protein